MRLVRFRFGDRIATGVLKNGTIEVLQGTFFQSPVPTGEEVPLDDVRLLAPVLPSKVVGIGLNYRAHAREFGKEIPEEPLLFLKPATAVIGPADPIPIHPLSDRVDYEGELAVVIGRPARRVASPADAASVILGHTCGNDVTLRDLQSKDDQWTRAKGFDGSNPLGPWIETDVDPGDLHLETRVNGEVRQSSNTSDMAYGPAALVAFISQYMTLLPGDVIMTGTPAGIGPLEAGDEVEIEIEGIGVLRNTAAAG
jgi:2-keto-4-pentenoate hydratase/2-oxohepta-3-ene-1,7-dioic acid hydratase in catechol pathway